MIQITSVEVRPIESKTKIVGFADVVFDDSFCVTNIKIINGSKGLFIAMPSTKDSKGNFKDICFPINKDARAIIEKQVLDAYEKKSKDELDI